MKASGKPIPADKRAKYQDAFRWWEDNDRVQSWLRHEDGKLRLLVRMNMELGKAKWFRSVAEAIEAEVTADGQPVYPLHDAVMKLGQLRCTTNKNDQRVYAVGCPLDATPRHTIASVCRILEDQGHKPAGQEEPEWKRTVRRVCREVGLALLTTKPGPKSDKS
jgi:hypothetical protein